MTGRREPIPQRPLGKNPLDVKQFPDALPQVRRPGPEPEPFTLPSDFPDAPKPLPPVPNFVKQIEQERLDRSLRTQLEAKKNRSRQQSAMRSANTRRQTRVFRDPANLQRFINSRSTGPTFAGPAQTNQPQDMDDTIVKSGGQNYRYDAEIDAFTPVNFDPEKNRFVFAGEDEAKAARAQGDSDGSSPQTEAFKVAKSAFDKQMTELKNLADKDQQFGDMYQELQGEYLEILRDPNLREEERQGALQDLFDRGSATFSATSGFARQTAEQKTQQEAAEARQKIQEDISYRNRRAAEAKTAIRNKQEDQRIDNAKLREKFSETTQKATADYNAYLEQQKAVNQYKQDNDQFEIDDEGNPIIPPPLSREEFLMERYKQEHTDRVVQETVREIDVDISLLETEIGQIEEADPMEYRMQLTQIYGQGRQEYADAAFEAHLRERDARIVNNRRKIAELKIRRAETLARPMVTQEAEFAARKKAEKETGRDLGKVAQSQKEERQLRGIADVGGVVSPINFPSETYRAAADDKAKEQKIMARDAAVERDMNRTLQDGSPNPNFGKVTSMDTPNYVAQELGDRTTLGDLRRLAHPDSAKKYFQGDKEARRKKEIEVIQRLNPIIQKMNPDLQPDSAEFNAARREYYDRVIAFEQSFDKEQIGSRGS
tara:strand:+ start:27 stop:2000 length:1974 start_codon:yes stop_codon:yes gene_type:complete